MGEFALWARVFVGGSDVTDRREAVEWVDRAQGMIDRIDDEYGQDVYIQIKLQRREEPHETDSVPKGSS